MHERDDEPTRTLLDGRYRLGERLGSGGMADVYRADDVLLGREVAIKMIRLGVDGTAAPERARGEVNVLASLNHPSLVTLLDARLDDGAQEYIVMELVEGPTLSQRSRESALPAQEVARLAGEIAEALYVVHAAGIVHRDIKPSNVLLAPAHMPGRGFRAKLADFGIAYLVDSTRVTTPGQVIGTAAYLAPEQVSGAEPAPPADIYALGLVLLEALTGRPAFPHAAGVASAIARLNAPPEIPVELGADWVSLLERMTRIEPSERPTALEVAIESSRLATGTAPALTTPIVATTPTVVLGATTATRVLDAGPDAAPTAPIAAAPARSPRRPARRRGVLIGAAALGVAAIIGGGAWGLGALTGSTTPAGGEPALTEPLVAPSTSTPAPVATPVTVGTEDDTSQQQADNAEKAQKEQEKAQQRADDEARKQAEDAAKQAEEQRKAEEKAAKDAEQSAPPAPTTPAQTPPPAAPSPAPGDTSPPADS